jgi:hypothetical protein
MTSTEFRINLPTGSEVIRGNTRTEKNGQRHNGDLIRLSFLVKESRLTLNI